jgi:hypothetical protein
VPAIWIWTAASLSICFRGKYIENLLMANNSYQTQLIHPDLCRMLDSVCTYRNRCCSRGFLNRLLPSLPSQDEYATPIVVASLCRYYVIIVCNTNESNLKPSDCQRLSFYESALVQVGKQLPKSYPRLSPGHLKRV